MQHENNENRKIKKIKIKGKKQRILPHDFHMTFPHITMQTKSQGH